MAILIVDDVTEVHDVVELVTYLTRLLANGETTDLLREGTFTLTRAAEPTSAQLHEMVRLGEDESCADPAHRPDCSCVEDAANTDPRQMALLSPARHHGPVPYVPCSRRGTHAKLTDCWMCWSDVHRGALSLDEALA